MLVLRPEIPGDEEAIRQVNLAAFPGPTEARLVDQLRSGGHLTLSLCAERQGEIVGHLALSPVTIAGLACQPPLLGLAPVAVLPRFQRQGIGSQLIQQCLHWCEAERIPLVVVLGDPGYYGRFGFVPASPLGIGNEYGVDHEFQCWRPPSRQQVDWQGLARYAPEFADL